MTTKYEPSSIDNFRKFISYKFKDPDEVSVIFDIGSLHCLESVELSKVYKNAHIYAFEANPESYKVCVENTKDIDNITVINKAINDMMERVYLTQLIQKKLKHLGLMVTEVHLVFSKQMANTII